MKKSVLIFGGIFLLVLLLGSAAYIGGRLLNGQGIRGLPIGGVSNPDRVILPAEELPQIPADVNGIFDHRQDQSIFVGTGNITGSKTVDANGNGHVTLSHDGPVVEVVVTVQTKIYKDTTAQQYPEGLPHQGQIQQVVEPGSLDEIGQTSMITIWGRKTSDRYIANVVVYTPPAFMK